MGLRFCDALKTRLFVFFLLEKQFLFLLLDGILEPFLFNQLSFVSVVERNQNNSHQTLLKL